MLKIEQLNQYYGQSHTLWDLDLDVPEGDCTVLMGRNGVGKTTLLKCIMGLLPVKGGTLDYGGKDLKKVSAEQRAMADPTDENAMKQLLAAEAGLSGALGKLFALQENYPDLKANENMMQLSEEITSTENKIAFARQAYNDSVMVYNTQIETVPDNFIAGPFNFRHATLWEIEEAVERQNVKVDFSS